MVRTLWVHGTEEYLVKLTYEVSKEDRTEDTKEFHYDYYEEAYAKLKELRDLRDEGRLGWNAHAEVVKVITMNEVFSYF